MLDWLILIANVMTILAVVSYFITLRRVVQQINAIWRVLDHLYGVERRNGKATRRKP